MCMKTGGYCSLLFFVVFFFVTISLVLPYYYDNIVETRYLSPRADTSIQMLNTIFRGDFNLTLTLYEYGDVCELPIGSAVCDPGVTVTAQGFGIDSDATLSSSCTSNVMLSTCTIFVQCINCQVLQDVASLSIALFQPLTFASSFQYRISTRSAKIPAENSVATQRVYAATYFNNSAVVFRGLQPSFVVVDLLAQDFSIPSEGAQFLIYFRSIFSLLYFCHPHSYVDK
jgi:hypothetical protein